MSIRYIFFDLDGTLLPMDQDIFIQTYIGGLCKHMVPHGFEPQKLAKTIWQATGSMFKNDGSFSNEEVFWKHFATVYGEDARKWEPFFDEFYHTTFPNLHTSCGFDPKAGPLIKTLKQMGYTLVLATNPLFPAIATENRMRWAGLDQADFLLYTTYENSRHCKPNPDYYRDILAQIEARPEECLMVGNDATEDLIAETLGMQVFLITGCLINKEGKDISSYPQGDLDALLKFIQSM